MVILKTDKTDLSGKKTSGGKEKHFTEVKDSIIQVDISDMY